MVKREILIDDKQLKTIELFLNEDIRHFDFEPIKIEKDNLTNDDVKVKVVISPTILRRNNAIEVEFMYDIKSTGYDVFNSVTIDKLDDFIHGIYAGFKIPGVTNDKNLYSIKLYNDNKSKKCESI